MIPALFTSTSMVPEMLDRCFDSFGSGLLFADVAVDENQVG
jgi:hypothetical protein